MGKLFTLYVNHNQKAQIVQGLRMLADDQERKANDMQPCDEQDATLADVDDLRDMADAIEDMDE